MHCVNLENVKCSSTPIIFYGAVIFKVISLRTWLREKARYFQPPNLNFVNKNRAITVQMWKDWIRALRWIPTRRWVVINISWWYCCTQIAKQIWCNDEVRIWSIYTLTMNILVSGVMRDLDMFCLDVGYFILA